MALLQSTHPSQRTIEAVLEMQHFISELPDPAVFTLMISGKRTAARPNVSWMHPPSLTQTHTHTPDLHCVIIKKETDVSV